MVVPTTAWLGAGAVLGVIAGAWGYIKQWFSHVTSYFVVTTIVEGTLPTAISIYCWESCKRSPLGTRIYDAANFFVRPLERYANISYERIGEHSIVFWQGWRPLILSKRSGSGSYTQSMTVTYVRGTWNIDKLIAKAITNFNKKMESGNRKSRFMVHRYNGSGPVTSRKGDRVSSTTLEGGQGKSYSGDMVTYGDGRLIDWKVDDLGQAQKKEGVSALGRLSMPNEIGVIVQEIERWLASEEWYKGKGIPWRRGLLLYGKPGTGKTSLVRAIGQDMDLPVFIFDLASMSNDELINAWKLMMNQVPCIALFEDIDAIFQGRDNVLGETGGGLTFDCFLNVIGGVEAADGVFTVITTNCIDKLDEALGKPCKTADGTIISTRPGRIDRTFELKELGEHQRVSLAKRLMSEYPCMVNELVRKGEGMTGAQFQELCGQMALRLYWEDRERQDGEQAEPTKPIVMTPTPALQDACVIGIGCEPAAMPRFYSTGNIEDPLETVSTGALPQ